MRLIDPAADMVYNDITYGLSGLLKEISQGSLWQVPSIKVLAHHDAEQAAVPHLRRMVSAVSQFIVQFLTFIAAFRRCPCIIFQFPFLTAPWRIIKKPRVISQDKMYSPAIFCIGTWIFTDAVGASSHEADFRAFEFRPALYGFGAVPAHGMPVAAYGDAVIVDGEIILIDGRPAAFTVEVNKWRNAVITAVFIISHGIMAESRRSLSTFASGRNCFKEYQL